MKKFFNVFLDGEDITVQVERYLNSGRTALQAYDEKGMPYAMFTTNIPDAPLMEDEVIFNHDVEYLLPELVEQGVMRPTSKTVHSGFVDFTVCKLLI